MPVRVAYVWTLLSCRGGLDHMGHVGRQRLPHSPWVLASSGPWTLHGGAADHKHWKTGQSQIAGTLHCNAFTAWQRKSLKNSAFTWLPENGPATSMLSDIKTVSAGQSLQSASPEAQ